MFNYKILVKVTGSIAAYKSAYLISKLVQSGCEVKVVASESALKFVGVSTFEGLTGNQVFINSFDSNSSMSHINLVKWADLTIVYPATANTINKLAHGIADTLLTSLFLAHDWAKPYLIVPAMNFLMYDHPATQESIRKLENWGVKILPTAEGYLACGDIGRGKLLEPDEIFKTIFASLNELKFLHERKKILITSGGTKEAIDGVRFLTNISTGKTASSIAEHLYMYGYQIFFLHSEDSISPKINCSKTSFTSFDDLDSKLKKNLEEDSIDVVIHLAAVSDYSPKTITIGSRSIELPMTEKINSDEGVISLTLKRNHKILERLKSYSKNKNIAVVGFKLTSGSNIKEQTLAVKKTMMNGNVDFVVANDLSDRRANNVQTNYKIYSPQMDIIGCPSVVELSVELKKIIMEKI
jgi:phosphopantothenoylcysteine decarboxylase / phosphopantothenate---cysteine ligase